MHINCWRQRARSSAWPWQAMFRFQVAMPIALRRVPDRHCHAWLLLGVAMLAGCGSPNSPPTGEGRSADRAVTPSVEPLGADAATSTERPATPPAIQTEGPPKVLISTSLGKITVELDTERAPINAHHFLTYANTKHYDQTVFHYVQPGEMILGGGFTADLKEKPAFEPIRNEAHNGLKNRRGTIAMSRSYDSIDSATSQFFVNLADNVKLDHRERTPEGYGYCVFGHVVAGMEVVDRIAATPTSDQGDFVSAPVTPVVIESVRLLP